MRRDGAACTAGVARPSGAIIMTGGDTIGHKGRTRCRRGVELSIFSAADRHDCASAELGTGRVGVALDMGQGYLPQLRRTDGSGVQLRCELAQTNRAPVAQVDRAAVS